MEPDSQSKADGLMNENIPFTVCSLAYKIDDEDRVKLVVQYIGMRDKISS